MEPDEQDNQLWRYHEPHESGGDCTITMTRQQAIDWMRGRPSLAYDGPVSDKQLFEDWIEVNWAYQVTSVTQPAQSDEASAPPSPSEVPLPSQASADPTDPQP